MTYSFENLVWILAFMKTMTNSVGDESLQSINCTDLTEYEINRHRSTALRLNVKRAD